jgi:hypothetical protein
MKDGSAGIEAELAAVTRTNQELEKEKHDTDSRLKAELK